MVPQKETLSTHYYVYCEDPERGRDQGPIFLIDGCRNGTDPCRNNPKLAEKILATRPFIQSLLDALDTLDFVDDLEIKINQHHLDLSAFDNHRDCEWRVRDEYGYRIKDGKREDENEFA